MNSARLTHLPTGLVVTAQYRKRPESESQARAEMDRRLDALLRETAQKAQADTVRSQTGCGAKADKRRTYRFQDNQVQDHATGRIAKADRVMKGHFDQLWC